MVTEIILDSNLFAVLFYNLYLVISAYFILIRELKNKKGVSFSLDYLLRLFAYLNLAQFFFIGLPGIFLGNTHNVLLSIHLAISGLVFLVAILLIAFFGTNRTLEKIGIYKFWEEIKKW